LTLKQGVFNVEKKMTIKVQKKTKEMHSKQTQKNGGKHHGGKNGRGGNNGGGRR
jgi:hypothetical protein